MTTPTAGPIIANLGGQVGGATLYSMINDVVLVEAGAYTSFAKYAQKGMGQWSADGTTKINSRPNTQHFTSEIYYVPFGKATSTGLPTYMNLKLSLQYIAYTQFDGAIKNYDGESGRNASDNNTLYFNTWLISDNAFYSVLLTLYGYTGTLSSAGFF